MTSLLALEYAQPDKEIVVTEEMVSVEGTSMGLVAGDSVSMRELVYGMLLQSGNDAANTVATVIGGNAEGFAKLMNERAKKIGMTRTFFVTPSGLDGEGHGSSAYDMALLAREALKNDIFREICSSESIKLSFGNPPYERWLSNTNKLLTMCEGAYGVKTGFTDDAGRCLVSACERDGMELICVTLNDKNDWNDHIAMYDYGFEVVEKREAELPEEYFIDLAGGECEQIKLSAGDEPINITTAFDDMSDFTYTVLSPPFAYAPVNNGEQLAELLIMHGDREVRRVPLYACGDYPTASADNEESKDSGGFFAKIKSILGRIFS